MIPADGADLRPRLKLRETSEIIMWFDVLFVDAAYVAMSHVQFDSQWSFVGDVTTEHCVPARADQIMTPADGADLRPRHKLREGTKDDSKRVLGLIRESSSGNDSIWKRIPNPNNGNSTWKIRLKAEGDGFDPRIRFG